MPQVHVTLDQVIEALDHLTPAEKSAVLARLQSGGPVRSRAEILEEIRQVQEVLSDVPGSLADDIIADREDRV